VDGADVRVIEGRCGPRLLLEALDADGVAGEIGRQDLQCDLPSEAQLRREPHLAHPSGTDERDDFVRAEPCARL
jgi:hypothetical protein